MRKTQPVGLGSDLFAEARPFQLDFTGGHVTLQSFLLSLGPNGSPNGTATSASAATGTGP